MLSNQAPVSNEQGLDPREFRRVMGLFATGISVVAVETTDGVRGMTANAVMSVSLEPLLVCVCVSRRARMHQLLNESAIFTINFLQEDQELVSQFFAGLWKESAPPSYQFESWAGGARLVGSLASIACTVHEVLEGGDHRLFLGRVIGLSRADEPLRPLLYYGGQYHRVRTPVRDQSSPVRKL